MIFLLDRVENGDGCIVQRISHDNVFQTFLMHEALQILRLQVKYNTALVNIGRDKKGPGYNVTKAGG